MSVAMVSSGEVNTLIGFIYYNRVSIISHTLRHKSLRELAVQIIADNRDAFNARYEGRHAYQACRPYTGAPEFCPSIAATKNAAEHIAYNVECSSETDTLCACVVAYCEALEGK